MESLSSKQMRQLLAFIDQINQNHEPESLPTQLLKALNRLIPGDCVSLNLFNRDLMMERVIWDPVDFSMEADDQEAILREHVSEHPFMTKFIHEGKLPATRITDVYSQRRLRQTGIYIDLYHPLRIEYQMGIGIPTPDSKLLVLTQSRGYQNFLQRDKLLLQIASSHIYNRLEMANKHYYLSQQLKLLQDLSSAENQGLIILSESNKIQWMSLRANDLISKHFPSSIKKVNTLPSDLKIWLKHQLKNIRFGHRTQEFHLLSDSHELCIKLIESDKVDSTLLLRLDEHIRETPEILSDYFNLTPREAEVVDWVSKGKTNIEISIILSIAPATVKKHLEHVYDKLEVCNRASALVKTQQAIKNYSKQH